MRLMDAAVCIDLLRLFPAALEWLAEQTDDLAIPGFVALEVVMGCRNAQELRKARKLLAQFPEIWATEEDMKRAVHDYAPFRLSHGLGGFDALAAATATGIGAELLTFNHWHFSAVPELVFSAPYKK